MASKQFYRTRRKPVPVTGWRHKRTGGSRKQFAATASEVARTSIRKICLLLVPEERNTSQRLER